MSTETKQALENALQAHIDDERSGFLVSGYSLVAHLATLESERFHYFYLNPNRQPYHATLGLLNTAIDDLVRSGDDDD